MIANHQGRTTSTWNALALFGTVVIAVLLVLGAGNARAVNPELEPPGLFYFGPFDMERGDLAVLHVVHPPEPVRPAGARSRDEGMPVQIRFFGPGGDVVLTQRSRLRPGMVETVELPAAEVLAPTDGVGQVRIWAEVRKIQDASGDTNNGALVPQLELVDNSGNGQIVNPAVLVGFNPQPEPPALGQ